MSHQWRIVVVMLWSALLCGCESLNPLRPDLRRLYEFDGPAGMQPPVIVIPGILGSRLRDRVTVLFAAGFDVQFELNLADGQFGRMPGVDHLDHVCVLLGNDGRCANKLARDVWQQDAQLHVAS